MIELREIRLRVADLTRATMFYRLLGFTVTKEQLTTVEFSGSDGDRALTLIQDSTAPTASRGAAGLFHAAWLLPSRIALATWLKRAITAGVEFDGFSDHGVSEAIYLHDLEGNGLEFYADRPRAVWPYRNGEIAMTTLPLDLDNLLAMAPSSPPSHGFERARWGHLHLRVTELKRSTAFYRDALGLLVTQRSYPGARFLAADGYHHHLGLNTWGEPHLPQPDRALGLIDATFAVSHVAAARTLRDPDSITLQIVPG